MKWLSVILSFYLLVLAGMPCTDGVVVSHSNSVFVEHTHDPSPDDQHERECSPLCICSCCACFTVQKKDNIGFSIPFATQTPWHSFVIISPSTLHSGTVWQPPRS